MTLNNWRLHQIQNTLPSQKIVRELHSDKCHTIYGRIKSAGCNKKNLAVAALSYKFGKMEIVTTAFLCGEGVYSLFLPNGEYQIFVFTDFDQNGLFTSHECTGVFNKAKFISLTDSLPAIVGGFNIFLFRPFTIERNVKITIPSSFYCSTSKYYPSGSIRSLNDPIFSDEFGQKGIYSPSDFLSSSPNYFYTTRERDEKRIPVIFVHGYGGTPRRFSYLQSKMDSTKYDFWYFYYPSGQSIAASGSALFEIFLSGKLSSRKSKEMVIVAHSMGGLVARYALNLLGKEESHNLKIKFISLCSPYGGSDEARNGLTQAPIIIPSWREIASRSDFLKEMFKTPLHKSISFSLFFAYKDKSVIRGAETSDGVVILRSQLYYLAQRDASIVRGFNESHDSMLTSKQVAEEILFVLDKK
jgi:pimeloyl-ACP methyl ester carboxylesterase